MPFDPELDEVLYEETFEGWDGSEIDVSVRSYNGGPLKIHIVRIRSGWYRFPLGRLSENEATELMPALYRALRYMRDPEEDHT